jgi:hypothetical protein
MAEIKKPGIPEVAPAKRVIPKVAYQMEEKNGGFQLFKITFNEDYTKFEREKVEDPDAWNQVINTLESELSRQFA